jgi:Spy/CpxP family protein refolding chaperone
METRAALQHAPLMFEGMMHLAIGLGVLGLILAHRHRHRHFFHGFRGSHGCHGGPGMMPYGCGPDGAPGGEGHGHEHGRGGFDPHGWRSRRRGFGRARARRFMLHRLFRELDASPAQERAIVAELEALETRVRAAADLLREGRPELAAVLGAPQLDEEALKAVTSRLDGASAEVRDAGVGALRAVHALLDDKQRSRLGELLDRRSWWRGDGMYR